MTLSQLMLKSEIIDGHWNFEESTSNSGVITVPADVLAPVGAGTSAGTEMTKLECYIYTGLSLTRLGMQLIYYPNLGNKHTRNPKTLFSIFIHHHL